MRAARWLFALAAAWAGAAAGHAGLVASIPADGAALAAPPSSIELRFTEPVTPLAMRLFTGAAAPVPLAAPQGASDVMKLALPADLREGVYTLSYRVISLDSHPVGGSIVFAIGDKPSPQRAAARSVSSELSPWAAALRAVRDLALLVAAGGALFVLGIARFPAERAVLGAAGALAIVAAIAGVGLQGADLVGSGFGSLDAWRTGLFSSFGLSASVAAAAALLLAFAAALSAGPARLTLLAAGALAAIASLPLTGHAMSARPAAVAVAALAAHGLAAAFWVGSLCALLATMSARASSEAAMAVLRRFSRWGMVAVAVLVLAGIAFVVLQLDSAAQLFSSRYGWLIVGKVVLLLALLLLALLNRFRWLPMLGRGAPAAARPLRWSIGGEVALVVCVIGVTAVLVQTPPPRAAGAERGYTQKLAYKDDFAEISVGPARAGANVILVRFQDRQGLPFDPDELLVQVANEGAGVEPAARPMRRVGAGHYRRDGSELAFPGLWTIEVHARMDRSGMAIFRAQVPIR